MTITHQEDSGIHHTGLPNNENGIPDDRWFAVNLSYFFAGIGQVYTGKIRRGLLLAGLLLILTIAGIRQVFAPRGHLLFGAGFLLIASVFYLWNLLDAYYCGREQNPAPRGLRWWNNRDPWLAVLLTQIVPGTGHLYLRKTIPGVIFLGGFSGLLFLREVYPMTGIAMACYGALVSYLAYRTATVHRHSSRRIFILMAVIVLYGSAGTLLPHYITTHLVRGVGIASTGMTPVIQPGDRFFVRLRPGGVIRRGDVLLIEVPGDTTWRYVKRVAGLGGERIEITKGQVFINGKPLSMHPFDQTRYTRDGTYAVDGVPMRIPENTLFLLGDHSETSKDSRHFGPVSVNNVIGKAYKIYWPLRRAGPIE